MSIKKYFESVVMTTKEKIKQGLLMTLCGSVVMGMIVFINVSLHNKKQQVKGGISFDSVLVIHNTIDSNQIITLPSNSVTLDYPTDTVYIHDTIYKTKIIYRTKNINHVETLNEY